MDDYQGQNLKINAFFNLITMFFKELACNQFLFYIDNIVCILVKPAN